MYSPNTLLTFWSWNVLFLQQYSRSDKSSQKNNQPCSKSCCACWWRTSETANPKVRQKVPAPTHPPRWVNWKTLKTPVTLAPCLQLRECPENHTVSTSHFLLEQHLLGLPAQQPDLRSPPPCQHCTLRQPPQHFHHQTHPGNTGLAVTQVMQKWGNQRCTPRFLRCYL